ncbi:hypothetical protein V6Z11_A11G041700 [Gossypium hirsutum]
MEEVISYPVLTVGGYKENEAMAWRKITLIKQYSLDNSGIKRFQAKISLKAVKIKRFALLYSQHSESQLSPTTATIQPSSNHQKHTNRGHNLTPLSTFPPPLFFPLTTGRKESEVAKIPTAFGVPSST